LRVAVISRAALVANEGRRAFDLLHGRLLDERLRLAMQVLRLECRGSGHGSEQRRGCDELLARSRGRVRVVDVEVGVDALAGLPAQLALAFATRESFSSDGGAKQSYRAVLLHELSLELARLS
jgi:hypothetical protein